MNIENSGGRVRREELSVTHDAVGKYVSRLTSALYVRGGRMSLAATGLLERRDGRMCELRWKHRHEHILGGQDEPVSPESSTMSPTVSAWPAVSLDFSPGWRGRRKQRRGRRAGWSDSWSCLWERPNGLVKEISRTCHYHKGNEERGISLCLLQSSIEL